MTKKKANDKIITNRTNEISTFCLSFAHFVFALCVIRSFDVISHKVLEICFVARKTKKKRSHTLQTNLKIIPIYIFRI